MLLVLQIPMADLRPFRANGERRSRPHWPLPDTSEFVRLFGPVQERKQKKSPLAWSDEQFYVEASRALTFPPSGTPAKWTCAFRRLLSDGGPVVRLEVGFNVPARRKRVAALDAVGRLMDLGCMVRGDKTPRKLAQVGKRLADLYVRGSTPRGTRLLGGEVVAGKPTVLVQYGGWDKIEKPGYLDFNGDNLGFASTTHDGTAVNLWLTSEDFGEPRATRTALLRLSAEQQCLKMVLRDINDKHVDLSADTPQTEALQRYLGDASRTLSKESRFGIDQTDLIRLTQSYNSLCGGDELKLLQAQLATIRPQIRTKILQMADGSQGQQVRPAGAGPDFVWRGDFPQDEFQAFMRKPRLPLSVAWISDVTSRLCPAVCLISVPRMNRTATGFLVGKDLLLTNYHVMKLSESEDGPANLADMQLLFTRSTQPARVFRLQTGAGALLAQSVKEARDYVLLRVAEDVAAALSVNPFVCDATSRPVKGQSISLMQHPNGEELQLSVDPDGVSEVYSGEGTVQYISLASGGSSGSPCIDGDKRLVAIHHAERGTAFGSIREGILMAAIYPEIAALL